MTITLCTYNYLTVLVLSFLSVGKYSEPKLISLAHRLTPVNSDSVDTLNLPILPAETAQIVTPSKRKYE